MTLTYSQRHILLVEDNADDAFLTQTALEGLSRPPLMTWREDGLAALEYLETRLRAGVRLPDLLLLDVNMPRLNGFGLLQRIRKHPQLQHLPVVILSTSGTKQDREEAKRVRADAYITKPHTFSEYSKVVQEVEQWLTVVPKVAN